MAQRFDFEEQDRAVLLDEIRRITEAAVEAGHSYRVKITKQGDWWQAVVTVGVNDA